MFWIIGGALVHSCIMGLLTSELAARKGYNGYFWTGFLLSSVGLLFVAGLTDNRISSAIESMKYSIKQQTPQTQSALPNAKIAVPKPNTSITK